MPNDQNADLSARSPLPVVHSFAPILNTLFKDFSEAPFAVRFWDGSVWASVPGATSTFELWLRNHDALQMLLNGADEVSFGEAYIGGDLYINGDLVQVLRAWPSLAARLRDRRKLNTGVVRAVLRRLSNSYNRLAKLGRRHSKPRDRAAAATSFDQSPAFYHVFLGEAMLYSAGWFESEAMDLQTAEEAKVERVFQKLALSRNQRFLDLGCGWGTLPILAATNRGALSHGLTLSREQINFANQRIQRENLGGRCAVDQRDYRDLDVIRLPFDRVTSLRTVEYVGRKNLDEFFASICRTLSQGGLLLNESVTRVASGSFTGEAFADRFRFPDRDMPNLPSLLEAAKRAGFEVVDIEDWREHYLRTFRAWLAALEERQHEALRYCDKPTLRSWKFYFASMAASLDSGALSAHQILLRKV